MQTLKGKFRYMKSFPMLAVLICATTLGAFTVPPNLIQRTDSLFADTGSGQQETFVEVIKERSTIYYAATVKTFECPMAEVRKLVENVESYYLVNSFVKKSEKISSAIDTSAYLIVMGIGFVRSWFLCNIDSVRTTESGVYTLYVNKNKTPKTNEIVRKEERGALTVEYYEFSIYWKLQDLGNDRTRVALIACVNPKIWIPQWLVKVTSKVIYPSMLRDFEKYLIRILGPSIQVKQPEDTTTTTTTIRSSAPQRIQELDSQPRPLMPLDTTSQ